MHVMYMHIFNACKVLVLPFKIHISIGITVHKVSEALRPFFCIRIIVVVTCTIVIILLTCSVHIEFVEILHKIRFSG